MPILVIDICADTLEFCFEICRLLRPLFWRHKAAVLRIAKRIHHPRDRAVDQLLLIDLIPCNIILLHEIPSFIEKLESIARICGSDSGRGYDLCQNLAIQNNTTQNSDKQDNDD